MSLAGKWDKYFDTEVPEVSAEEEFRLQRAFYAGAGAALGSDYCKGCGDREEAIIHHLDEDDEAGHKFESAIQAEIDRFKGQK